MKLKDIAINSLADKNETIGVTGCVSLLYLRNLKNYESGNFKKVIIRICSDKLLDGEIQEMLNVIQITILFDFDSYSFKDKLGKKQALLEALHAGMLVIAQKNNWETEPLSEAYKTCLNKQLQCEWFFKERLFPSSNKNYYIGLYNIFDIDTFEIYEVLFDNNKKELKRRKCYQDKGMIFNITWASWEKTNDTFYYKFDGPKKVFQSNISELIKGKEYTLPLKVGDYFR